MSKSPSEAELRREFASLLRRDHGRLFGYIHALLRDLEDAEDVFQQTSVVLWRKFDQYDRGRSFLAWACGIARFEVSNFLRTRSRSRLYFSDELNLLLIESVDRFEEDEHEARREALDECVERLRPRDRSLLEECYASGRSITDIAGGIGRSPQSVHNSLRRIRGALFECIRCRLATDDRFAGEGGSA